MVAHTFEEYSPGEEGYLKRLDVDPYAVLVPGESSQAVGHQSGKEAVEVEEKEESEA